MKLLSYALLFIAATTTLSNAFCSAQTTDPAKTLDGTWQCGYLSKFPGPSPEDVVKKIKIKFAGTKVTWENGDEILRFTMKADFSKQPAEIDLIAEDGPAKGEKLLGLFVLKNDELTMQFGYSRTERLKWNESGGVLMLIGFKRIK